jgi:formylglycine-generating enzyme required for sulfatase activity
MAGFREYALPLLRTRFEKSAEESSQKLHAAFALAAFGEVPEEFLISRIPTAPSSEAKNAITALGHGSEAVRVSLARKVKDEPDPDARARYASTLLHLGDPGGASDVLALGPDPTFRTAFILGFKDWHGELWMVPRMLADQPNDGFRSGLCAALGSVEPRALAVTERAELEKVFAQLYQTAPDGGTHSAAGWALRQWGAQLPKLAKSRRPENGKHWFVNESGMTMIEIRAATFQMGEKSFSDAPMHPVTLTRSYFVCDTEVTIDQFQRFMDDSEVPKSKKSPIWLPADPSSRRTGDCPAERVSWEHAVTYCNWLSLQEGRDPCYRPSPNDDWVFDTAANGYRLLTEAEWEFACRANTESAFSFGDEVKWFNDHGTFVGNSNQRAWRVATKLPNSFGLFDMHGNVDEWCWDWYGPYAPVATDPLGPLGGKYRVKRGGGWHVIWPTKGCTSGYRDKRLPTDANSTCGFRIATSAIR